VFWLHELVERRIAFSFPKQLLFPGDTFIVVNDVLDIQTTKFDSAGKV
jgi:hypothetical protein